MVRMWEVSTGECLTTLQGHTGRVWSVACSPQGTLLASGDHNGTVSLWDVSSGTCLRTLHSHPSRVWVVAFSLDGSSVVSASEDRTIIRWNVRTGERLNMVRNRLYERMNITGITGLTEAQKATLRELGAVEEGASRLSNIGFLEACSSVRRGEGGVERLGGPLWTQSGGLCGPLGPCTSWPFPCGLAQKTYTCKGQVVPCLRSSTAAS